ncbi:hypothetical protein P389DRAFT_167211 [Cystobasidium minutum MCA 4210]|uniref:uncharacterized protein n=1 Tax=Cystobasidium minutum MCA 4210 TaxID=1397322 RepID=UPI0034CF94C1|eukprot:jgi/Rhomi1/167211/fgenesh1_kg.2_\
MCYHLPFQARTWYDTAYYESFAVRHAEILESFDLGPLSFLHEKKLSDLAIFPKLENIDIDNFRLEYAPGQALKDTFEYQQLPDFDSCEFLISLSFRNFYTIDPPQHLGAMQACISCLDKEWLSTLSYIELEGYQRDLTVKQTGEVIKVCERLFIELEGKCVSRNITLSGAFVDMMEEGLHNL